MGDLPFELGDREDKGIRFQPAPVRVPTIGHDLQRGIVLKNLDGLKGTVQEWKRKGFRFSAFVISA